MQLVGLAQHEESPRHGSATGAESAAALQLLKRTNYDPSWARRASRKKLPVIIARGLPRSLIRIRGKSTYPLAQKVLTACESKPSEVEQHVST
jgi:hypothetical protein